MSKAFSRVLLIVLFSLLLQVGTNAAEQTSNYDLLANKLRSLLDGGVDPARVGVHVRDVSGLPLVVFDHNGEALFSPGSTQKLVTTAAALDLLGPDFRYTTMVEYEGEDGRWDELRDTGSVLCTALCCSCDSLTSWFFSYDNMILSSNERVCFSFGFFLFLGCTAGDF